MGLGFELRLCTMENAGGSFVCHSSCNLKHKKSGKEGASLRLVTCPGDKMGKVMNYEWKKCWEDRKDIYEKIWWALFGIKEFIIMIININICEHMRLYITWRVNFYCHQHRYDRIHEIDDKI